MNLFYVTEIISKRCFSKLIMTLLSRSAYKIILTLILRVKPYNLPFLELFETQTPIKNRVFSHDVTAAILVSQNNETAAMLVSQTSPVGVEFLSYGNASFVSINLLRCWPREWKHSIKGRCNSLCPKFPPIFWLQYAQLIIEQKCASWLDTTGGTSARTSWQRIVVSWSEYNSSPTWINLYLWMYRLFPTPKIWLKYDMWDENRQGSFDHFWLFVLR